MLAYKYNIEKVSGGITMKRFIAKLLSFLLMIVVTAAVVCRLSENFSVVYRITGVRGVSTEEGDWELYTARGGEEAPTLILPKMGMAAERIAEPKGFAVCMGIYLVLLFMGRKRSTPQRGNSAVYRKYDAYDYCSEGDTVSDEEVSEDEVSGFLSVSETSLPEIS